MKNFCPDCQSETYTNKEGTECCTRCSWWYNRELSSKMQKVHDTMYKHTVHQRDSAWREIEELKKERDKYKSMLELRKDGIINDLSPMPHWKVGELAARYDNDDTFLFEDVIRAVEEYHNIKSHNGDNDDI